MSAFVEAIKLVGGLGGIASSIFLFYDRLVRPSLFAYFQAGEYKVHLVVKSVSAETLIIDEFTANPSVLGIAKTNDLRSTIEAVADSVYPEMADEKSKRIFALLDPLQERSFGLIQLQNFEKLKDEERIQISFGWRNTRKPLPFKRRVTVTTTAGDLRSLKDVAVAKERSK